MRAQIGTQLCFQTEQNSESSFVTLPVIICLNPREAAACTSTDITGHVAKSDGRSIIGIWQFCHLNYCIQSAVY